MLYCEMQRGETFILLVSLLQCTILDMFSNKVSALKVISHPRGKKYIKHKSKHTTCSAGFPFAGFQISFTV